MNGLDIVGSDFAGNQIGSGQLQGSASLQAYGQSILPYQYYYQAPVPIEREPRTRELVIEQVGDTIRLDYGAELRVLIADPIRGIDLREGISKLKEALLKT
jgi:hypothetical protein